MWLLRTPSLLARRTVLLPQTSRRLSFASVESTTTTTTSFEEEQKTARQWLATLTPNTVPRRLCEVTFSRSSGPGGQNVNKTNSKATLRVKLQDLRPPMIPEIVHVQLQASRYYAEKSNSLVIQTDASRKRAENIQGCYDKLQEVIQSAASAVVKSETSPEQIARVNRLQKQDNEARLAMKKAQSAKKGSRRGKGSYDY